jgi:hypothetical protein
MKDTPDADALMLQLAEEFHLGVHDPDEGSTS